MITSGGKTSFTFHEIGHSDSNGTIAATGAAFFDTNATGKLAFLGDVVAVYKDQIYRDGTDKVIAWKCAFSFPSFFLKLPHCVDLIGHKRHIRQ